MQIHELTLAPRKEVKRIGRGGKRGTTSGRGTKGQGAHGKKKDPLFEGGRSTLIDRMKKSRGFKSPHAKKVALTFTQINARYVDGEVMMTESEHAAMSACVGAGAAGGRVATATSSQGLALMVETLYQASGMRMPIVLCMINRALAAPLNVNGDHSDMYLANQSGWISIDACTPEESYDLVLCAFRIAEHKDVRLPVIVNQDGFLTSHKAQNVRPLSDEAAYNFVGNYVEINSLLNFSKPVTHGVQTESDWHFEHKAKQHAALMASKKVILETFAQFKELTGREYKLVESYNLENADIAIVCLGTTYETAMLAIDQLKAEGINAAVVAPRVFRPFPLEEVAEALQNVKAIACMDRSAPGLSLIHI